MSRVLAIVFGAALALVSFDADARCVRGAAGCGVGYHGAGAGARGAGLTHHHHYAGNRNGGANRVGRRR